MTKLTLNLDDIQVESFSPGGAVPVREMIPTTRTQEPTCTCYTCFMQC